VPGMGVPVREEPAIENEYPAYLRAACGFAPLRALKPTLQMLQDDKRGKVEGDQRRRADTKIAPDRFYQIGTLRGRIRIVFGLVAVTKADVPDKELGHPARVRQIPQNLSPPKRAIRKPRQEGHNVSEISFPPQEHFQGSTLRLNDSARIGVIADALAAPEPSL